MPNRIIKPGEVFLAKLDEIPTGFHDVIVCLDKIPKKEQQTKEEKELTQTEPLFTLHDKGGNWYDVINPEGKAINDKSLRRADAEELMEALNK